MHKTLMKLTPAYETIIFLADENSDNDDDESEEKEKVRAGKSALKKSIVSFIEFISALGILVVFY